LPTPLPTPSPTRTPIVALALSISGITCDDFNGTVFDLALDPIVTNATFTDPIREDATSDSVSIANEATVPLIIAASWGKSVHEHVTDVLNSSVVEVSLRFSGCFRMYLVCVAD